MSDSRPGGHGSIHWTTATLSPVLDECDRLRAENEALNLTLISLWSYLRLKPGENHKCHGLACGIDACILCLAEGEIRAALQRSGAFDESQQPEGQQ